MAATAKQQTAASSSVRNTSPTTSPTTHSASGSGGNSLLSSPTTGTTNYLHATGPSTRRGSGDEDIEQIAKQISDHAEAIYQTWKARGLAPSEILKCHTTQSDAFSKSLLMTAQSSTATSMSNLLGHAPDMSNNNNLEKLVSSFVTEDKARQQAARKIGNHSVTSTSASSNSSSGGSILTSGTIKDALRKFEIADRATVRPNYLRNSKSPSPVNETKNGFLTQKETVTKLSPTNGTPSNTLTTTTSTTKSSTTIIKNSGPSKLNKNVPDVLMNTIERRIIKEDSPPRQKPETPVKPANLVNHQPSWPLKNRLGSPIGPKRDGSGPTSTIDSNDAEVKTVKRVEKLKKSIDLMDEVLMEEERLINALKTGAIINNNNNNNNTNSKMLPEVITSTLPTTPTWNKPDISKITTTTATGTTTITTPVINTVDGVKQSSISTWDANEKPLQQRPMHTPNKPQLNPSATDNTNGTQPVKSVKIRLQNDASVPHPESSGKPVQRSPRVSTGAAGRPFLTRGSVAERVLMFEKCPEVKLLRQAPKESTKVSKATPKQEKQSHTTLQRSIRSSNNVYIPRFHYPHGKPTQSVSVDSTLQRLQAAFSGFPNNQVPKDSFASIMKICGLPLYWRMPLFHCTQLTPSGLLDGYKFCDFWKQMSVFCHDAISRFVFILSKGQRSRAYILPEDLVTMVQDVVDTHPGLAFLKEAAEFHSRYVHTVIARIFYTVNRSWSGKITLPELRRSNLLEVIQLLQEEEDINQIMAYFSYEHFYVIYCKFWELDRDHDLFIDQNDLARHNDHALSTRIIERIFSGCVTRGAKNRRDNSAQSKMSYTEFVWFLLSEEDKTHPTAVEYWFRCMDLDGDGILSMYELEYFYEEQQHRMESIGIETLPFEDCLCQMLDMIKPTRPGFVTLGDLKRCKMTPIFFDTFFNLEKYMEHEQRDPFATQRDQDEMTDWDRYAAQEYELLVAEEGGDTQNSYDEDEEYESNIDILNSQLDDSMSEIANEW